MCVTFFFLLFSDVRNVFDVIQQCENGGRTKYCRFDISTKCLGVICSENSLNCYNLKSRGWDEQVMWMGQAGHVDGIRKFRTAFCLWNSLS